MISQAATNIRDEWRAPSGAPRWPGRVDERLFDSRGITILEDLKANRSTKEARPVKNVK